MILGCALLLRILSDFLFQFFSCLVSSWDVCVVDVLVLWLGECGGDRVIVSVGSCLMMFVWLVFCFVVLLSIWCLLV